MEQNDNCTAAAPHLHVWHVALTELLQSVSAGAFARLDV